MEDYLKQTSITPETGNKGTRVVARFEGYGLQPVHKSIRIIAGFRP
jgi:hypothetical protein